MSGGAGERGEPGRPEEETVREVARRAVWRITILEYVLLAASALLAVLAGGLVAWGLTLVTELPLVPVWIAAAVLVFALPAAAVWRRERRETRGPESG